MGRVACLRLAYRVSLAVGLVVWAATATAAPWTETAKLVADDGASWDIFGCDVCLYGSRALIAARWDDDSGSDSGSAYVFENAGGTWSQAAKLTASDGEADDLFGGGIALGEDLAIIGAPGDDDNGATSGAAYVFRKAGGTWTEVAKLTPGDGAVDDRFGGSVSLSGNTAIIGARGDDGYTGSAYIFRETGGTWSQVAKLVNDYGEAYDNFGWAVSLSGSTALVGVPGDDPRGDWSGSAYVFEERDGVWQVAGYFNPIAGAADDRLGRAVSLSGDTAIVGAEDDDDNGYGSGSAYIYERTGNSWSLAAKLTASDGATSDGFGCAVSVDGDTALVGAFFVDGEGDPYPLSYAGAAYVFRRDAGTWTEVAKLTADDAESSDNLGIAVSVDDDVALVGAYRASGGGGPGAAYVFSEAVNQPPTANADGPYQFTAAQLQITLNGSGSSDDIGIAAYDWNVDGGTTTLSGIAPSLHVKDSGLASQSDIVNVALTVTDTGGMTDDDTSTISYQGSDPVIDSFEAIITGDTVNFLAEIEDGDLAVNQWIPGFQEVTWELDLEEALTAASVGDGLLTGFVGGSDSAVIIGIDETLHLSQFAAGPCTVWLNVSGSLTCGSVTFWNHYPEPSTLTLLALGGLGLWRRRRQR